MNNCHHYHQLRCSWKKIVVTPLFLWIHSYKTFTEFTHEWSSLMNEVLSWKYQKNVIYREIAISFQIHSQTYKKSIFRMCRCTLTLITAKNSGPSQTELAQVEISEFRSSQLKTITKNHLNYFSWRGACGITINQA